MLKLFFTFTLSMISILSSEPDISTFLPPNEKEAVEFLKKTLKELPRGEKSVLPKEKGQCYSQEIIEDPLIKVFISFSVPDEIWIELSQELQNSGGVFVLKGLPDQSFKKLAAKILSLKNKGVLAPIQIDPVAFKIYKIGTVPTFVISENDHFDKISGSISLHYATETIQRGGEN